MRNAPMPSLASALSPSKIPLATAGESWNRLLTHGSLYGLNGNVEAYTLLQPVALAITVLAGPFPLGPLSSRYKRFSSVAMVCAMRSQRFGSCSLFCTDG